MWCRGLGLARVVACSDLLVGLGLSCDAAVRVRWAGGFSWVDFGQIELGRRRGAF